MCEEITEIKRRIPHADYSKFIIAIIGYLCITKYCMKDDI